MGTHRRKTADRGAAAVEFALVLPLVLMLMFGMIDFGRMLNAQITVTESAREAARAASLGDTPSLSNTAAAGLGASIRRSVICGVGVTNAEVEVTYDFSYLTPVAVLGLTKNPLVLSGRSVMPCRA